MDMSNRGFVFLVLALLALLIWAEPAVAEWQVWTVTETRRVLREDPAEMSPAVNIAAARNEWESFQVLVRSDAPVRGIRVEAGDLRGPDGAMIAADRARLFRQHQFQLTEPTYRNDQFRPGWYPDGLIPFVHPLTGKPLTGARLKAVPLDLPAGQTQGFWVDLFVPADARPGTYRGSFRVTAEGVPAREVPVTVTVWDFALPEFPTMQTSFGSPAHQLRGYYRKRAQAGKEKEPADWKAVDRQCAELLRDHHINATPPGPLAPVAQPDGTFRIPPEQVRTLREFVDRYRVNAINIVHPSSAVKDPERERARLHAWLKSWDEAAAELDRPQVTLYTYLLDEPNDLEAYRYVQKWGRAIREARSVVKVLVVEQTWTQDPAWGDLYGAVDIWCPLFCLHKQDSAAKRQALGETIWTYTALCQGDKKTPWWHTDFPLLHYRVPAWMMWRDRMRGLLYWGSLSFWDHVDDPWLDPKTYDLRKREKGPLFNGEGSLVYPGRPAGYDGIASSLRLKALRDAIEDYEYLAILERKGLAAEAEKIVLPLTDSFFRWDPDPKKYQEARVKLAGLIVGARDKPSR
jgi:hypothetical protein